MQDNQRCMLLENNGQFSAGKGSKHIDVRYFFITDQIKKKHIKVQYCPTKEMLADFMTKPLQGHLFYKFQDAVLGVDPAKFDEYRQKYQETLARCNLSANNTAPYSSDKLQECVGSNAERASEARANDGQARKKEAKQPLGNINLAVVNSNQIITTKKKKVSITP